jgi:hypothetical protein
MTPPKEKSKELLEDYLKERCLQIADQMICHYIGLGIEQLRTFWEQVYGELMIYDEEAE